MSTKNKGKFTTPLKKLDDTAQAKINAFTSGGRADNQPVPPPVPEKTTSKRGRPSLDEETKRTVMALRKDDIQRVEELCLRWKRESDAHVSIKITMVLRSLLAESIAALESLEAVEDESHLREMIQTLIK